MATIEKKNLKNLPNSQVGVSERSAVRRKLMARPICPVVTDPNKDGYTGEENCQIALNNAAGWWDYCVNRGHDPYHSVTRVIKKKPIVGEDMVITGYREEVVEKKVLNTASVPIGTRFSSGRGETISKGLKGRKTLTEMGYNEKCEFRNCELNAKKQTKYGLYCGERHARLIGADVEGITLEVLDPGERQKQLRNLDIEFEGTVILQSPPFLGA